jgi:metallo-beta-lactamase class B
MRFRSAAWTLWAALSAPVTAQALFDSGHIAQPHLQKAREYAARDNSWRHPGLSSCYWDDGQASQNLHRHPQPARIFDEVYYVGNGKYGVYAIDTSDGIILIDAMNSQTEVDNFILPNMRAVGLDPARIKILLFSHGHPDHYGGGRYLKQRYPHIRMYLSDIDWNVIPNQPLRSEQGRPPERDITVADGDHISLGGMTIETFVTPGHTPGSLSLLFTAHDKGVAKRIAYYGGVTHKQLTPELHRAFDTSYARLIIQARAQKVDGYLSGHPNFDDAVFKLEKLRADPRLPNPFLVGTDSTASFLQQVKECNLNSWDIEKAMPKRATAGFVAVP